MIELKLMEVIVFGVLLLGICVYSWFRRDKREYLEF